MKNSLIFGKRLILYGCALLMCTASFSSASDWTPVTGTDTLKSFMSGMKAERTSASGEVSTAEYFADGTGVLKSWGAAIPRTWEVKGDSQLCFTIKRETGCYTLERSTSDDTLYRVTGVTTGETAEFTVTDGRGVVEGTTSPGEKGGAAAPSADEIAAELSNPNTLLASMTFKNQFRWFDGDLPESDEQSSYTLLFQPSFPFQLPNNDKFFWRPAVPIFVDQPTLSSDGFSGENGLGDIAFDLAYAPTLEDKSTIVAYGIISSLPTATNDLGSGQWTLGPEFLVAKLTPTWVAGLFPSHQWDVAGWTENNVNLTSMQLIYTYLPGGGWNVGSAPTLTYDWESEQWTVPLQLNAGKTVIWNDRPWKLSVEVNYYVEKADSFGPEWMVGINVAPVIKNGLASLFGLD